MSTTLMDAVIVFADIVEFSRYGDTHQHQIITSLNAEMSRELFPHLTCFASPPSLICLPSGDGMAVVFASNQPQVLFSLLRSLIDWTKGVTERVKPRYRDETRLRDDQEEVRPVQVRVGVHVGALALIADINRQPTVYGDAINVCRRIMDQARPNQVLFSADAYDMYSDREGKYKGSAFDITPARFSPQKTVTVKHGKTQRVRVMYCEGDEQWNDRAPMSIPMVLDGADAMAERTRLINSLLADLAAGPQREVAVYEQASFSTFSITGMAEAVYTKRAGSTNEMCPADYEITPGDPKLVQILQQQLELLETLMRKKVTTVSVLLRRIDPNKKNYPGANARFAALADWMEKNLDGDVYIPTRKDGRPPSRVWFQEAPGEGTDFWDIGGPNRFMVSGLVRIDGYRIVKPVGHRLSLVYYEEDKIREAVNEFDAAFNREPRQTNQDVLKKLESFKRWQGC